MCGWIKLQGKFKLLPCQVKHAACSFEQPTNCMGQKASDDHRSHSAPCGLFSENVPSCYSLFFNTLLHRTVKVLEKQVTAGKTFQKTPYDRRKAHRLRENAGLNEDRIKLDAVTRH